jgi:signal transduction histidine kinase
LVVFYKVSKYKEKIILLIVNNGIKIPDEVAVKIFETSLPSKNGFGLGLTIVKRIALEHNSDIELKANQSGNVVFEMELNCEK